METKREAGGPATTRTHFAKTGARGWPAGVRRLRSDNRRYRLDVHRAIGELKEGKMADTANTTLAATSASTGTTTSAAGWRTEDWIAVILGFLVLAAVLAAFQWKIVDLRNLVQTYRWTTDGQIASFSASWTRSLDAIIAEAQAQKQENVVKLGTDLRTALAGTDRKAIETAAAELGKLGSRTIAGALGAEVRGHAAAVANDRVFTSAN